MKAKKLMALWLTGAMCFSMLTGCGNSTADMQATEKEETAGGEEAVQEENVATAVPEGMVPAEGISDETLLSLIHI